MVIAWTKPQVPKPKRRDQEADGAPGLILPSNSAGLLAWWQRQFGALLPGWVRRHLPLRDAIIVEIRSTGDDPAASPTGQILIRKAGRERLAAPLDFSRPVRMQPADVVILRLPPEMVLRREMTLPAAAARDLRSLIHFQIDQLTPFDANEVFWGISEPLRDQARLQLRLHLVPRQRITHLLGLLAKFNLEPSVLEAGREAIVLARLGRRKTPGRTRAGIGAGLALACLVIPAISQQVRLRQAEHRLAMLMPVRRQISAVQAQIASVTAAQRLIDQAQPGAILHRLALLSGALPDGTWLNELDVKGDSVSFDGQSGNAADLISTLAATPGLRNVRFSAPVSAATGGADAFSIQLSIPK
jgi:general secretion pathway protein L